MKLIMCYSSVEGFIFLHSDITSCCNKLNRAFGFIIHILLLFFIPLKSSDCKISIWNVSSERNTKRIWVKDCNSLSLPFHPSFPSSWDAHSWKIVTILPGNQAIQKCSGQHCQVRSQPTASIRHESSKWASFQVIPILSFKSSSWCPVRQGWAVLTKLCSDYRSVSKLNVVLSL